MTMGTKRGGAAPARALLRGAAAAALLCLLAAPALASERVTVNHTDTYVDPAIAGQFVTTPTLCTEPVGTQGTSPAACNGLGDAAVLAATGSGPDVYFEPFGLALSTTNAFVPGNSGSAVNDTGYAPLFSDHKYDLFGRAGDRMGPLSRREIFLLGLIDLDGGITTGQTVAGDYSVLDVIIRALIAPEGVASFVQTGEIFQISDLPVYEQNTGFSTGKLTTITNYCTGIYGASPLCLIPEVAGLLYLAGNFPELIPTLCTSKGDSVPSTFNCNSRDAWMDQTVAAYTEAWASLGGDNHFAQNFRSQVGYDATSTIVAANTEIWTDFRLEQSVELSGAFTTEASDPGDVTTPGDNQDNLAGRQTFQQAIATESLGNLGFLRFSGSLGQLVAQDVNGYFSSCLNCDTATYEALGQAHAFTPAKLDLTFMPYTAGWQTVPTIVHAQ